MPERRQLAIGTRVRAMYNIGNSNSETHFIPEGTTGVVSNHLPPDSFTVEWDPPGKWETAYARFATHDIQNQEMCLPITLCLCGNERSEEDYLCPSCRSSLTRASAS